ncbi:short-chain dehydrogenase/reductase-like protein [Stipitochalara longipes BDJ]|nr:short-chain dehydrogenase/reductase-like protein [Stipitochalara longipes BDJ]
MSKEKLPTVLITGCTDGSIGHGLVLSFARQGYHVFATARRLSAMASLEAKPNITLLELDVTSPESIRKVHEVVSAATSGRLDVLYNNAGVRYPAMAIETAYQNAMDTMAVNFSGSIGMVRVFSDLLLASKGKIVFTSSGAGQLPVPTQVTYNASKAALDMYARTLRLEMKPLGVGVINVITGNIRAARAAEPLPPLKAGSPYKPIEEDLNHYWKSDKPMMDLTKYCDAAVKKVAGKNPPDEIWLNSDFVWWVYFLKLGWLFPIVFAKEFGLSKLAKLKIGRT